MASKGRVAYSTLIREGIIDLIFYFCADVAYIYAKSRNRDE